MIVLLLSLFQFAAAQVGTAACSTYADQATCKASGYCTWSGSCGNSLCYMVDEVAACRSGGALVASCSAFNAFSLQYTNVCGTTSETKVKFSQIRFPISTAGTPTNTLTGVTCLALRSSVSVANLYQLYTFNMQTATNTQLLDILDTYIAFDAPLISDAHPYYMEKAIFQSLQNVRDDTSVTKPATITKIWGNTLGAPSVATTYFKRLRTFSKHYQTNYYFVNFAQTTLSRLYLTVNGQEHTTTISWTTYNSNGYIQVLSYPADQLFSSLNPPPKSDIIMVSFIDTPGTGTVSITPKFTWISTVSSGWVAATNLYLVAAGNRNNPATSIATVAAAATCITADKRCDSTLGSVITSGIYYFS